MPKNPYFNMDLYLFSLGNKMKMELEIFQLFSNYLQETQDSFISNNFYNIERYMVSCPNCQNLYIYEFKKIIRFNVDELYSLRNQYYPLKMGKPLSLTDCFNLTKNPKNINCPLCGNCYAIEYK